MIIVTLFWNDGYCHRKCGFSEVTIGDGSNYSREGEWRQLNNVLYVLYNNGYRDTLEQFALKTMGYIL